MLHKAGQNPSVCYTKLDIVYRIPWYVLQSSREFTESIGLLHKAGQNSQNPFVCYKAGHSGHILLPKTFNNGLTPGSSANFLYSTKVSFSLFHSYYCTLPLPDVVGARKNRIESADNISDVLEVKLYTFQRKRIWKFSLCHSELYNNQFHQIWWSGAAEEEQGLHCWHWDRDQPRGWTQPQEHTPLCHTGKSSGLSVTMSVRHCPEW
jgi:hypothetical protein